MPFQTINYEDKFVFFTSIFIVRTNVCILQLYIKKNKTFSTVTVLTRRKIM